MQIKYRVRSIDPANLAMVVNYFNDEFPEGFSYNIDIHPNLDGTAPTLEQVIGLIEQYVPHYEFKRMCDLKRGVDISHLQHLIGEEREIKK